MRISDWSSDVCSSDLAVARSAPGIMLRAGIAVRAARFLGGARGGIFRAQSFEIIPTAIIFGGVAFAKIPAFGAVRRLGRRAVAGVGAAVAIAQTQLLRFGDRKRTRMNSSH